jgi:hypothetical protein
VNFGSENGGPALSTWAGSFGRGGDGVNWGNNSGVNSGNGGSSASQAGGSGIIVLRYPDSNKEATVVTGSPAVSVSNGYRVYTFTGSGSINWT